MVQFGDSYTKHRHHSNTPFEYFEYKRRGVIRQIVDYCFPSAVAVVWTLAFVAVCVAIALVTLGIELPGGW